MTEQFANTASSTLNGTILSGDLSLVVASAASFPTSGNFRILIENEILLVTGVAGTTFTVSRGQEGTTAQGHNNGVVVTHILTAGALAALKIDAAANANVIHGNVASEFTGLTEKTTPVAADLLIIEDSAGGTYAKKKVQYTNLRATDPLAFHTTTSGEIAGLTNKPSPILNDLVVIEDSAAANAKKKATLGSLPMSGVPATFAALTANDILVYHLNDGQNSVIIANSGSYGTVNYAAPFSATLTTSTFTVPAVQGTVTIPVLSTSGYYVNAPVFIGGGAGYYTVTAIVSTTSMTVQNMATAGNTTLGGLNASPSTVIVTSVAVGLIIENSPTTTTVNFTQPNSGNTVQITVGSTTGYYINCQVFIGGTSGYHMVTSIDSATLMTIKNIGVSTNASGGTNILSGATVQANADMVTSTTDKPIPCKGVFNAGGLYFPGEAACAYGSYSTGTVSGAPRFFGTQLTFSCWFKPTSPQASTYTELWGRQTNVVSWTASSYRDLAFYLSNTGDGAWIVGMDSGASGPNTTWTSSSYGRLVFGQWNHMVVTFDLGITSNNVNIYLNGLLISTASTNTGGNAWGRFLWGADGAWFIGNARTAISTWTGDKALGGLAECRVTQGILNSTQIANIWAAATALW